MASSGSKVTITEELRRYGKNISICTQRLQGLILGQSQETRSPVEDGEDDCEENEVFVEEGDVWLLVPDESREMAEEDHVEAHRLSKAPGPLQTATTKLQQQAIEAAFEAADVGGQHVKQFVQDIAEDSGWLFHCDTADELLCKLLSKYPILLRAGPMLNDVKDSWNRGRDMAVRGRAKRSSPHGFKLASREAVAAVSQEESKAGSRMIVTEVKEGRDIESEKR